MNTSFIRNIGGTNPSHNVMLRVTYWYIVVDPGFREVDADNPGKEIDLRCMFKLLCKQQQSWLTRLNAVAPPIAHIKSDCRMDRCWLQQALGDAMHSMSRGAGYNQRCLMRDIMLLGNRSAFL